MEPAQYGADVIVTDIDETGAQTTAEEVRTLGRKNEAIYCDIAQPSNVETLCAKVDQRFGRVNILVNVPDIFPSRVHPDELSLEDWEQTLHVNLIQIPKS